MISVHQYLASRAEVVLHCVAAFDRLALRESGELVLATDVHGLGFFDSEVGREHRERDFVTIRTVAYERVSKAITFGRLR